MKHEDLGCLGDRTPVSRVDERSGVHGRRGCLTESKTMVEVPGV